MAKSCYLSFSRVGMYIEMSCTACTDLIVQRAVVTVVQRQELAYDNHSKDTPQRNCISHRRLVDDRHPLMRYMTAMNGMIGVHCSCCCDV